MVNNAKSFFLSLNSTAIGKIENLFAQYEGVRLLNEWEIPSTYIKLAIKVWRLNILKNDSSLILDLLLGQNFPFAPPRVVWVNHPKFLTNPHIEENGFLCILPNSASVSFNYPERIVSDIINDALNLIEENTTGINTEDFRTEFNSYWNRLVTGKQEKFISLIEPQLTSKIIYSCRLMGNTILADTKEKLQQWVKNRYNKSVEIVVPATLIHISELPIPINYPKTNRDVYTIVKKYSEKGIQILKELAQNSPNGFSVLLISESLNGKVIAGARIKAPQLANLSRGFRPKRVPKSVFLTRYLLSDNKIGRFEVERMDSSWIYGRDSNLQQPKLSSSKVILIGCGSVGSSLTKLLASSGIGKIVLIDPDILSSANIGRHYLGAKYVGEFKASSMKNELQVNYPHIQIEAKNKSWQEVIFEEPETFDDTTLIISSTGNWESDSMLNLWQNNTSNAPKIIYGWTEAFAVAGHALTIFPKAGCLQCQRDEFGKPIFKVADFAPEDTLRQEPTCGITYQPYGSAELSNTISLIGQTAIDVILEKTKTSNQNIWIGQLENIILNNGELTLEAATELIGNNKGGIQISRPLQADDKCVVCHKEKAKNAVNQGV